MAKILFGVGVADARNKLGGHVFSKNRNGAYIRQKVSPTQPRTPTQLSIRSAFTAISKAWGAVLDDAARAAWAGLAATNPVPDQFGNPQILTGAQMYMKVNRNRHTIGVARLDVAPPNQGVGGFTALSMVATAAAHTIILTFAPTPTGANDHPVTFATPGMSAGRTFVTPFLKLIDAQAAGAVATGLDVGPQWEAIFGPLAVGQKITVNLFNIRSTNGAASSPASASTIVV